MEILTKARLESELNEREKRNLQIAYEAACESIVLLENDGVLPVQIRNVALYGSGARKTVKGGGGSGEVNERHSVSIYEGMKAAGFVISTEKWLDDFDASYDREEQVYQSGKLKRLLKVK